MTQHEAEFDSGSHNKSQTNSNSEQHLPGQDGSHESAHEQAPEPARAQSPSGPRTGPIVWGALVLVFCAYVVQRTFDPAKVDVTGWLAATVIGLGLLLLVVGTIVVVKNRKSG